MSAAQKRIKLRSSGLTMGPRGMDLNRDTRVMTKRKSDGDKNTIRNLNVGDLIVLDL